MGLRTHSDEEVSGAELKHDLETLREDLRKLRIDVRGLAANGIGVGRSRAVELQEELVERAKTVAANSSEVLKRHPATTLLVSFATGMVAGLIMSRRR